MKQKLKILIIPPLGCFPDKKNPINAIYVKEQAMCVAQTHDVTVLHSAGYIYSGTSAKWEMVDETDQSLRIIRVRFRKPRTPGVSDMTRIYSVHKAFQLLLKSGFCPDIIHAHTYSAGAMAATLSMRYRIPFVITEHSSHFYRGMVKGYNRLKTKLSYRMARVVCPVSTPLQHETQRQGMKARYHVVPNLVDLSRFQITSHRNHCREKRILIVGHLTPIKGIPLLLQALSNLQKRHKDNFVLDIVGDGPQRQEYELLSRSLGVSSYVVFHGRKSNEEVADFMQTADFFVSASQYETFGIVLIEALASGIPVIATDSGGQTDIVTPEVGTLIPSNDIPALEVAIEHMLKNHQTYQPQRLREYVQEKFSKDAISIKWDQIYQAVLNHDTIN